MAMVGFFHGAAALYFPGALQSAPSSSASVLASSTINSVFIDEERNTEHSESDCFGVICFGGGITLDPLVLLIAELHQAKYSLPCLSLLQL